MEKLPVTNNVLVIPDSVEVQPAEIGNDENESEKDPGSQSNSPSQSTRSKTDENESDRDNTLLFQTSMLELVLETTTPTSEQEELNKDTTVIDPNQSNTSKIQSQNVRKKRSWIWGHYLLLDNKRYCKCKYCASQFFISGTGTLSNHLLRRHPDLIGRQTQPTSSNLKAGTVNKPFKFDQEAANKAFIEFLVTNSHAFTMGEERTFQKFIRILQPNYKPMTSAAVKYWLKKGISTLKNVTDNPNPFTTTDPTSGQEESIEDTVNVINSSRAITGRLAISDVPRTKGPDERKKKRSWIWEHYSLLDDETHGQCKYCTSQFLISGTGTMSRHLYRKHPDEVSEQQAGRSRTS